MRIKILRLFNCQGQLKETNFEQLLEENQKSGKKLLDVLSLIQAEENIIKCEDILQILENTLKTNDDVRKTAKLKYSQRIFQKFKRSKKSF